MNANLRRGMLGTLFGGGLPALSCTAANAADSTSGSDLFASALISAAASADSTSLGLLGGPTPAVSADVAAVADHSATDLAVAADAVVDLGTAPVNSPGPTPTSPSAAPPPPAPVLRPNAYWQRLHHAPEAAARGQDKGKEVYQETKQNHAQHVFSTHVLVTGGPAANSTFSPPDRRGVAERRPWVNRPFSPPPV